MEGQDQKKFPEDEAILRSVHFHLFHNHFNVLWTVNFMAEWAIWITNI